MEDSETTIVLARNAGFGSYLDTTRSTYILKPGDFDKIDVEESVKVLYKAFASEFPEIDFICYKQEQNTCTLRAKSGSGKEYAIKTLLLPSSLAHAEEEEELDKFSAETDITEMMNKFLHGKGVAKVVSYGKKDVQAFHKSKKIPTNIPYFITEYYPGGNLESIAVGGFSLSKKVRIFIDIAETLSFLHDNYNLVHRDLKPANIMLTEDAMPVLIDFGSFEVMGRKYRMSETGTQPYFSPTQARSMLALKESIKNKIYIPLPEHTYRTDLYALTLVMADVLFRGRGDNTVEIINELYPDEDAYYDFIASDPLIIFPDTGSTELDDILARGVSNKQKEMFSSMMEFKSALASLEGRL